MLRMNKVQLVGAVGNDAEVINLNGDKVIVKASLAVSDNYKGKDGEWVDNSHWFRLVFLIPTVSEKAKEIKKGDKIFIEGKLVENKYTNKEGKSVSSIEIHVMAFQFAEKKSAVAATFTAQTPIADTIAKPIVSSPIDEEDSDLPFN
jgi:single-strand DNA-binding protein